MKRTGNKKIAVVGWGRGMGHTGHMYLADAVIQQAKDMQADPYFFVSKTVGKDDPIYPEEKLEIYQTVFPEHKIIFSAQGNLNQALTELSQLGYDGVVVVVGADQKEAFKYLENPNKEGVPVYQTMGFKKLRVISRQETRSKYAGEEGPRATPMREILKNPNATDQQKFEVWRRDMPNKLSDEQVMDLMNKASQRMAAVTAKATKLKEFITRVRPLLRESSVEQKLKVLKLLKEFAPSFDPDREYGGGEDRPEYQIYQCNPDDEFEWISGPLYQAYNLDDAHGFAYKLHMQHPTKAFMIYQPSNQASRGGYGLTDDQDDVDESLDESNDEYRPPGAGFSQTLKVMQKSQPVDNKFVWKKPNQISGSFRDQDLLAKGFKKSQYGAWGGTQRMWDTLSGINEDYLDEK